MINNLSKLVLDYGGSVQYLTIPSELSNGTGLCNPSICKYGEDIYVNIRNVQYSLYHSENKQKFQSMWGPLAYLHPENDMTLRTTNFLCKLNPDTLNIDQYSKIDTTKLDVEPLWEFIGLEDGRLVNWHDKMYLIGVRRDTTPNGVGRMEYSEIVNSKEVTRTRIEPPTGPGSSYCEKNWMPISDMPDHFVKWSNPTEVVKANLETRSSVTVNLKHVAYPLNRDVRGGSQVIPYKGYHIALTHEVDLYNNELGNKDAQYYHRFIVWDKDWNIVKVSDDFKFFTSNIEFSCGLIEHNEEIVATVGFQDTTAFLVRIPFKLFDSLVGIEEQKLYGLPRVNYISYIDEKERRDVLEKQINELGLKYKPFISTPEMDKNCVVTGNHIDDVDIRGKYCTLSHLRAIKNWYNDTDEPYGFFVEDDFSFETVKHWSFTWKSFMSVTPKDFDCLQLVVVKENNNELVINFKERYWNDWSVTGYILTRKYAKHLIDLFYKNENFTLNLTNKDLMPIVENVIYSEGKTYTFPLFIENSDAITTTFKRNFNNVNLELRQYNQNYHNDSSKYLLKWWKENSQNIEIRKIKTETEFLLKSHIESPYNILTNFNLGQFYFTNHHWASALSFFLRAAEYGDNDDVIYESLIKVAQILGNEGGRPFSEKGAYLNAISFQPQRPEAYYFMSLYHERNYNWFESYNFARIGEMNLPNAKQTLTDLGYAGKYAFKFQQAVSAWWMGRTDLSRELFFDLSNNHYNELPEYFKQSVQTNISSIGCGRDPYCRYNNSMYETLKYKFDGSEKIEKNYSQVMQDMFVLTMLNGKRNGTYLEIGAADPYEKNNTVLLEKQFDWTGVSIEILESESEKFKKERKNPIINKNALDIDYNQLLKEYNFGETIDYLQVDCEPPKTTYEIMTKIPFDKYKFAVITFEHDYYADCTKLYKDLSRKFLISKGYVLVGSGISPMEGASFEDWWVHPDLVRHDIIDMFKNNEETTVADKFMRNL